jgi:uncharacterized protein (TIGR03067 family)
MFMRTAVVLLFLFVVPSGGPVADDAAVAMELKALSGIWKLVSVEVDGKLVASRELADISFTLHPDGKSDVQTPNGAFQTNSAIDPIKKPKKLDVEYLGGQFKGKTQYGIYKVEGDRWTVFSTPPGGRPEDRPTEFDSKKAKGGLVVWQRVKQE